MKGSDETPLKKGSNAKRIFDEFVAGITLSESRDEIESVALIVLEKILGITSTDVMARKPIELTERLSASLSDALKRINNGEPVQYVVNEAFFYGRRFMVNPSVLIPRPETEELIRAVLSSGIASPASGARILDIGTGSGCISVTLFLELQDAKVFATDISNTALDVAKRNAEMHDAAVTFFEHDVAAHSLPVNGLDVVVSNPPYVTLREADQMQRKVKDFEPHLALFVPNDDPLLFYRVIVKQAMDVLNHGGLLAVEINENFGQEVAALFRSAGFADVQILLDVPGKPRVVRGRKLEVHS